MSNKQVATFGGGCFWCIEAIVQRLEGIEFVVSGYSGGNTLNPTYQDICSGTTEHAEVVQVTFDADVLSYEDLITIFMASHDPTTLNRQGADKGTQYRSIILYHNEEQKSTVQRVFGNLKEAFENHIVTQLIALDKFYPAEKHHQDYYNNNSSAGYCRVVINPKINKLKKEHVDRLKEVKV